MSVLSWLRHSVNAALWTFRDKGLYRVRHGRIVIDSVFFDRKIEALSKNRLPPRPQGEPMLIVSLTSSPDRIKGVCYALYSILNQSLLPNKIILSLSQADFPGKEGDLPERLLSMRAQGVELLWSERSLGGYGKLTPVLQKHPGAMIAAADDSLFYRPDWLLGLVASHRDNSGRGPMTFAHRILRAAINANGGLTPISHWEEEKDAPTASVFNIPDGRAGVLYPPHTLGGDALDPDVFLEIAPEGEDLFFWAMAVLAGARAKPVDAPMSRLIHIDAKAPPKPFAATDPESERLFAHYPDLSRILARKAKTGR